MLIFVGFWTCSLDVHAAHLEVYGNSQPQEITWLASGFAVQHCLMHGHKKRVVYIYRFTPGAAWLQFCRRAGEKEGNSTMHTPLCYVNRNVHAPACKQEK